MPTVSLDIRNLLAKLSRQSECWKSDHISNICSLFLSSDHIPKIQKRQSSTVRILHTGGTSDQHLAMIGVMVRKC